MEAGSRRALSTSAYYTEHKPKNKKNIKPGKSCSLIPGHTKRFREGPGDKAKDGPSYRVFKMKCCEWFQTYTCNKVLYNNMSSLIPTQPGNGTTLYT